MKKWQIAVLLDQETQIFKEFFNSPATFENGQKNIDEKLVTEILSKSTARYYITSDNQLRLLTNEPKQNNPKSNDTMSILEAYKRFGADAITEVVDYGSFDLSKVE